KNATSTASHCPPKVCPIPKPTSSPDSTAPLPRTSSSSMTPTPTESPNSSRPSRLRNCFVVLAMPTTPSSTAVQSTRPRCAPNWMLSSQHEPTSTSNVECGQSIATTSDTSSPSTTPPAPASSSSTALTAGQRSRPSTGRNSSSSTTPTPSR